jgi:putative colanic acid biosynthesis UDP-glucose lipid carrier transferase
MLIYKLISSRYFSRYIKPFLLFSDLLFLNVIYAISVYIQYQNLNVILRYDLRIALIISNLIWIILTLYRDEYKFLRIEKFEFILIKTIRLIFYHSSLVALSILILKLDDISRLQILYFYSFFIPILSVYRLVFINFLKNARKKGLNNRNVVIIGVGENVETLNKFITSDVSLGYQVLGFFSIIEKGDTNITAPYLGSISSLNDFSKQNRIDEMYISLHYNDYEIINKLISFCEAKMIRIKFIPDFHSYTKTKRVNIDFYDKVPVLMFRKEPLQLVRNIILKRLFDIFFSTIALIILIPFVFPIIILAIKINSRGPVFFIQKRSGENNNEFNCFKFRTMSVNNSPDQQAVKNDPRITKVGAFLRKTSLDELPQFINVLIGNMSVVGPRPHPLYMTTEYQNLVNSYLIRHFVKPGITGWAQVNGYRGETQELKAMKKRVEYDIWYIENWNLLLDLKIIFLTVYNMIKGEKNAY